MYKKTKLKRNCGIRNVIHSHTNNEVQARNHQNKQLKKRQRPIYELNSSPQNIFLLLPVHIGFKCFKSGAYLKFKNSYG